MSVSSLISSAQTILTSLIPLATEQINAAVFNYHDDLTSLHRRLTMIQSLLRDAENKRSIPSEVMKLWLKNLKLATCDAENLFDEINYESLKSKFEVPKRDKVSNFFSPSNPLAFRLKIATKVKNINSLLDKVCREGNGMGLRPIDQILSGSTIVEPTKWRLTHPFVDDSNIVGRKEDVKVVKKMLLMDSDVGEDLPVVAVVGMGGLGKTTLAQLVYKAGEVVDNFDKRMWICVSDDFGVERLLNEMVQSLTRKKSEIPNVEGIVGKLGESELLKGKKYLLTLDDVWNTSGEKWEEMRSCLLAIGGSKGSKVLVTTRSMDVLSAMQASPILTHRLNELSHDDCWAMFRKRAFANGGPRETQPLVVIGKRMVQKCKGVPLAINSLGGLLYSKHYVNEWESIEKSNVWGTLDSADGILPVLRLSFDHLPSPCLKQCFTYCSIFPKDRTIMKDEVIQLWMGLGYLQPSSGSNLEMEDVGNEYFNILSRNSLFQEVKLDPLNNVETCKMHDLVHDLAVELSDGNCLTLKASKVRDHPEVQHLSLSLERGSRIQFSEENIGKLRTLFLSGYFPRNTREIKCVRALSLEDDAEDLQSSLRKFIHLRYLHLSKYRIEKLPNVVTCLYNLQTLRLSPSANLVEIPNEFHKMVSLRHLCIGDTKENRKVMPKMVGHLTSLQTLPFFVVGEDKGHKIEELGSLTKLRGRLHVYDLQHVKDKEEAEQAQMLGKSGITELGFHWDRDSGNSDATNHEDVLEGLKPHSNLRGLKLENFGGRRFASWMRSRDAWLLENLVKIELRDCRFCEQLPALGDLPHHEVVEMDGLDSLKRIGLEFYGLDEDVFYSSSSCSSGAGGRVFPALRILTLSNMLGLEEWSDLSSSPTAATSTNELFPCLKKLCIRYCPQLVRIIPLGHIPHLEIVEMYGLNSLKRIGLEFYELDEGVCHSSSSCSSGAGRGVFPALRILTLSFMLGLEELSDLSSSPTAATSTNELFPCLEKLYIRTCPQLVRIIPLGHIPHLEIIEMDGLDSLKRIGLEFYGPDEGVCHSSSSCSSGAGRGVFPALRILTLSNMLGLKELSDLSSSPTAATSTNELFPCLEKLCIRNCPQLVTIIPLGHIPHLEIVEMDGLDNLTPIGLDNHVSDKGFVVDKSSSSGAGGGGGVVFPALRNLSFSCMSKFELEAWFEVSSLPFAATNTKFFPDLENLYAKNCSQLLSILGRLLYFRDVSLLSVDSSYGNFEMRDTPYKTSIVVDPDSKSIALFLEDFLEKNSKSLRELKIKGLNELCYFPNQLLNPASLEGFEIRDCPNLMYIIEETEAGIFNSLTSLRQLLILRCSKLRCLPKGLLKPTLVTLEITWCPHLDMPDPDEFRSLTTLQNLTVGGCPKWVRSWEEGFLCLTSLKMLEIGTFSEELECFPWPTKSVEIPESLSLWGWPKCKYLPDQLQDFNAVRELEIYSFDGLEALLEWLGNVSSLQSLTLTCCKNLMRLPSLKAIQRLTNLQSLTIESCPLLSERCLKGKGEEWHKIAHLQYIKF